jgi:squalene cyclase
MLFLIFSLVDVGRLSAEDRALAYLAREVPRWSKENKCFSCHNNGDAARTLYLAIRLGRKVNEKALADTTAWLIKPDGWDRNPDFEKFSNKQLDRLQFGMALLEAMDDGLVKDRQPLQKAAAMIAGLQDANGSWPVGSDGNIGSPTTYGPALATAQALRLLKRADAAKYEQAIAKADAWLRKTKVKTVLDAAAVLLALEKAEDPDARTQRQACYALIRKGEARDGGWGPYVSSEPEVFDTALVLLAVSRQAETKEIKEWQKRGRAYLLHSQKKDGSWQETTRPSGADSYAQRISTTAWATQALLGSGK